MKKSTSSKEEKARTSCIRIIPTPLRLTPISSTPLAEASTEKDLEHPSYTDLLNSLYDSILITDGNGKITDANARAVEHFLYTREELCNLGIEHIISGADATLLKVVEENFQNHQFTLIEAYGTSKDGKLFPAEIAANRFQRGGKFQYCFFIRQITRRKRIEEELRKSKEDMELINHELRENQAQLVHSEKMAALGQIAAGVAHEINNPVSFVSSNFTTLTAYVASFKKLLAQYDVLISSIEKSDKTEQMKAVEQIVKIRKEEKIDYLLGDVDHLLSESIEGAHRVRDIVQNLKSFARLDEAEIKEVDLNEGIETTLKIISNEIKYRCKVQKKYGKLPLIRCYAGQLNQVFLNLLVNAAQAITSDGTIGIETEATDTHITIRISDTGSGIAPEHLSKIFTPFFTTKPVGKGTGLGLSISYGVVKKHHGTIEVESVPGKGTTFIVQLPLKGISQS